MSHPSTIISNYTKKFLAMVWSCTRPNQTKPDQKSRKLTTQKAMSKFSQWLWSLVPHHGSPLLTMAHNPTSPNKFKTVIILKSITIYLDPIYPDPIYPDPIYPDPIYLDPFLCLFLTLLMVTQVTLRSHFFHH
jgi:hypothetical protein